MKPYAVELGNELGEKLRVIAEKRHFTLSGLVRQILWSYLDRKIEDYDVAKAIDSMKARR